MSLGLEKLRKYSLFVGLFAFALLPIRLLEARLHGDTGSKIQKYILGSFGKPVMDSDGIKGPSLSIVDISKDGKKGHNIVIPSIHPLVMPGVTLESDYYTESLLVRFEVNGFTTFQGKISKAFSRPRPLPLNLRRSWTP